MLPDDPNPIPAEEPKKLPAANEFSPGQVALRRVLELVHALAGDRDAILAAIRDEYFLETAQGLTDAERREKQQRTRAYNVLLGASKYGLVDLTANTLTTLGEELRLTPDATLHDKLAAHILKHLHGLEVLEAIEDMQARGDTVTKTSLQTELELRGFKLPRATTHHTKLVNWLGEAGVVRDRYKIDPSRVADLAGVSLDAAHAWESLTEEQKAFLRGLRNLAEVHGSDPISAKQVVDHVTTEYGPIFKRPDQLRAQVFKPLEEAGWLTLGGIGKGRGGKSGTVAATPNLLETDLELLPQGSAWGIPADLRPHMTTPLPDIYNGLKAISTHDKGTSLELLAIRVAVDLTLVPIRLRERARATGDAEVDLIAEGAHLHFSRWLIQCKNTAKVNVAALAKEVGMAVLLKAQVIVLVTTGTFSSSVVSYASELGGTTGLQAVLVDKEVLAAYKTSGPSALRQFFRAEAQQTLRLKRPQLLD